MQVSNMQLDTLEQTTCSRCGGSGQYSYCQTHGTRCFKCGGKGQVLTARGKATNEYLRMLRSKKTCELVAGDKVRDPNAGIPMIQSFGGFATVASVSSVVDGCVVVVTDKITFTWDANSMWRVAQTKEQMADTWQKAMRYQSTLDASGVQVR